MKRTYKERIFLICITIFTTVFMALGQSLIDSVVANADAEETSYDLLPVNKKDIDLYSTDGNADIFDLTPESITSVTADGILSDFLIPDDEFYDVEPYNKTGDNLKILIYHTHATEAYRQTDDYKYKETSEYRTEDNDKNIVAVGDKLKCELEKYGFTVFHDTTNHEPPKLATSYERSEITMNEYRDKYDIDLYIDVHRDAADIDSYKDDVVIIDNERCARIMFVVGKGLKYDVKPDFDSNYSLALAITDEMESIAEGFTRKIRVKDGRYNQHISNASLLVEVGHNANTLDDATATTKHLARAITSVMKG